MAVDFPHEIDSSLRKNFVSCNRKSYYSDFRSIRPKGENQHLLFGGAFARGLEIFRKTYYGEHLGFDESMRRGAIALIKEYGWFEPPENSPKTLENCLACLDSFFSVAYPPDTDPIRPFITETGEPAVEFSFALPIPDVTHPEDGGPILYTGRFDMLAKKGNAVFVNDEKTAGQLGTNWANQFKLSSQITGYCWAAKQFGHSVQGAYIRGVSPQKTQIKHQIEYVTRTEWEMDRWLEQLKLDIDQMIWCWNNDYWHYNIDDACGSYGGCPFLPLCRQKDPEPWIKQDYEVYHWSPLEKVAD